MYTQILLNLVIIFHFGWHIILMRETILGGLA